MMKTLVITAALLAACLTVPAQASSGRPLSPMMQEINAVQEASQAEVEELSNSLAGITDTESVLVVQREITRVKTEARLETYRIQLRFAVAEGHPEAAAKLEAIINRMTTPQPSLEQTRPAPDQAGK